MPCVVEDLLHGAVFHDLAGIHHGHTVCHVCHNAQVMGDVDNGHAQLLLQVADQLQDLCLNGHVQRSGGLVADQDLRAAGRCNGNDDTLTHTAGELVGVLLVPTLGVGDTHLAQHLDGSLFGFLALQTLVMLNALLDLLADLLQRVQAGHRVLHDHGDLFAADTQPILLGELGHIAAFIHDGAAGDHTVGIQHTHKGLGEYGLARAGLAHNGKGLAFVQVQRALADGVQLAAAQAKSDLHVFGRDNRLSIHLRLSLQSIKRGCADQPHPTKRCP